MQELIISLIGAVLSMAAQRFFPKLTQWIHGGGFVVPTVPGSPAAPNQTNLLEELIRNVLKGTVQLQAAPQAPTPSPASPVGAVHQVMVPVEIQVTQKPKDQAA